MGKRDTKNRFCFVPPEEFCKDRFPLPPDELHHLVRVLRLPSGSIVTGVNGIGQIASIRLDLTEDGWVGVVIDRRDSEREPRLQVTLAAGLLKGNELDGALERAVEMGITAFIPMVAERSVAVPSPEREEHRRKRWGRIALSAMKVARAARLPEIKPMVSLRALLDRVDDFDQVLIGDPGGEKNPIRGDARTVLLLIGPEGGFTAEEIELVLSRGASSFSLGPRNLRASTASTAALARLLCLPGDPEKDRLRDGPEKKENTNH